MTEQATKTAEQKAQESIQKYLTFELAGEEYGLEIQKVHEIISMMDITSVPQTPEYVKGVINLRGKVVPTIDLRAKFGMPQIERTKHTCIIVVDVGNIEMGIIVDRVSEVMNIAASEIEEPPDFGSNVNTDFIRGLGKIDDSVKILLNIERVLTASEVSALDSSMTLVNEAINPQQ